MALFKFWVAGNKSQLIKLQYWLNALMVFGLITLGLEIISVSMVFKFVGTFYKHHTNTHFIALNTCEVNLHYIVVYYKGECLALITMA